MCTSPARSARASGTTGRPWRCKYKGKNIYEVLDMTVEEAAGLLREPCPRSRNDCRPCADVGLGYVKLGQSSTTLSGGEAQRVKLATELSKRSTGKTIYILDEPTTGLHTDDVQQAHRRAAAAGGGGQHGAGHRAQSGRDQDRRLSHRPGSRRGRRRRHASSAAGTPEEVAAVQPSPTPASI